MTAWLAELARGEAVPDGMVEWSAAHASFADGWRACQRPDWMLWMASRHNPSEAQQRRIIETACAHAGGKPGIFPTGTFHLTLTEHQLAAAWAGADEDAAEYRFADFINALFVTAFLLIPIFMLVYHLWPAINPWRRLLYGDLITIPAGVLFVLLSFIALRRHRRSDASRRLRDMTWERARAVAFARLAPEENPRTAAVSANTLRERAADFVTV